MKRKALLLVLLPALSWALFSQERLSSPEAAPLLESLRTLDEYLRSIEANSTEQQRELQALRQAISDATSISEAQALMLNGLRASLDRLSATRERQAVLLRKSLSRSKVLSVSLIVGVPAAAALGIWAGWTLAERHSSR